jgi:hypothetical protein
LIFHLPPRTINPPLKFGTRRPVVAKRVASKVAP